MRHRSLRSFEARGETRGLLFATRNTLTTVLEQRQLQLTEDQRTRIEECQDLALLQRWVRRSATATSPDEVFLDL